MSTHGEGPGFGSGSGGEPVSEWTARVLSSLWISHIEWHGLILRSTALLGPETMSWGSLNPGLGQRLLQILQFDHERWSW